MVSFLAAGVDVVIATDHDVVTSYAEHARPRWAPAIGSSSSPASSRRPTSSGSPCPARTSRRRSATSTSGRCAATRSLPRNGAPWDELREPGQMMDDMDGAVRPDAGRAAAQSPVRREQAGARPGLPARDRLRPAHADRRRAPASPPTCCCGQPGGPGGTSNLDWDVQEVMTGASRARLAALPRALVLAAVAGHRARGHRQQRHALAGARAGRLPAQPRLRRPPARARCDVETLRRRRPPRSHGGHERPGPRRDDRRRRATVLPARAWTRSSVSPNGARW